MEDQDDHNRTIVYGESAISFIKRHTLPGYPRSYELWYTYSAGYNHGLNRAINDVLRTKTDISTEDMLSIYGKYLSPTCLGDQLDEVGSRISNEANNLIDAIKVSSDAAAEYGTMLEYASRKLKQLKDPETLEVFMTHLAKSTHSAVATNRQLEDQLIESKRQIESLQSNLEVIRYESLTDELTTLNNRKHFDDTLERTIAQYQGAEDSFALLITDIDHFKKFNDTFGHQTGDQVLQLAALATKNNVKGHDTACRYGGDEFATILSRADLEEAIKVAEAIREAVMSKELVKRSTGENLGRITVSIGISIFTQADTAHSLIVRADEAMYAAKRAGRNMVKTEKDLPDAQKTDAD